MATVQSRTSTGCPNKVLHGFWLVFQTRQARKSKTGVSVGINGETKHDRDLAESVVGLESGKSLTGVYYTESFLLSLNVWKYSRNFQS